MEVILCHLTTEHYRKASRYHDNNGCPLAVLLKESFPDKKINVGAETCSIDQKRYTISGWTEHVNADNEKEVAAKIDAEIAAAKAGEIIPSIIIILNLSN